MTRAKVQLPEPINLSNDKGEIPVGLKIAVSKIMSEVPGLVFQDIGVKEENGVTYFFIKYSGWSPSFHRAEFCLQKETKDKPNTENFQDQVIDLLQKIMKQQREKQKYALEFSLVSPMDLKTEKKAVLNLTNARVETRHLTIDKGLAVFAHMVNQKNFISEIEESLIRLHSEIQEEENSAIFDGQGYAIFCGLGNYVGTELYGEPDRKLSMSYDGMTLKIYKTKIPETIVNGLAGKKLSSLIEINKYFNDRYIRSAETNGSCISLSLEPDIIPLENARNLEELYADANA